MLQEMSSVETVNHEYQAFRATLDGHVCKIVEELEKPARRNVRQLTAQCAIIDGHVRAYQTFLASANAQRLRDEAQCETRDDLLQVRRQWGMLTSRINLFQNEMNRWPDFKALVLCQRKPKRRKLYWDDAKLPEISQAQMLASDDNFNRLHAIINPLDQSDTARDHNCFPDIGLSNSDFHAHMHAAYRVLLAQCRSLPARFLDVGCGAGLKVLSALRYFDECEGFDFDPAYIRAGQQLFSANPSGTARIFEQDALTYDAYDKFDVIYFYRPSNDTDMLVEMEKRIIEKSRPGTLLVAPYDGFEARYPRYSCGRIAGDLYLSHSTQARADAWRRKAELIGPFILKEADSPLRMIWSPILDVSHRNGYDFPSKHKKPRH